MTHDKNFDDSMLCDEKCFESAPLTRREFGVTAAAAGLATSGAALAAGPEVYEVVEKGVMIETPDGMCDSMFLHPPEGAHSGALLWTDIRGLRESFRQMGRRLAAEGYAVLVPNPFYRHAPAPFPGPDFSFQTDREMMMPVMGQLMAPGAAERDTVAFVDWLDAQDEVDSSKKMGTTGYCMGGPLTMRSSGMRPDRIGAAGAFHAGGLVTDAETSPHLLIPKMELHYHVGIAVEDDKREPHVKDVLRESFDTAEIPATIEVYEGANHGWCVPDSRVYNEPQAERAWATLMDTFKAGLA